MAIQILVLNASLCVYDMCLFGRVLISNDVGPMLLVPPSVSVCCIEIALVSIWDAVYTFLIINEETCVACLDSACMFYYLRE